MSQKKLETVDEDTRWECQKCMLCCKENKEVIEKAFKVKSIDNHCPFLKDNKCEREKNKPLICKLYPFFPGVNKDKTRISFAIGNLQIFSSCPGVGKGKKISENKELLKKIDKIAKELMERLVLKSQGKINDIFEEKNEAS